MKAKPKEETVETPNINQKELPKVDLPLIVTSEFEGYCITELDMWMDKRGIVDEWRKWHHGATGAIVKINAQNVFVAYKWDVEQFLAGQPNLD